MVDETQETTTIRIKVKTHEKLKKFGVYGESMDDIISRLMFKEKEKNKGKKSSYEDKL